MAVVVCVHGIGQQHKGEEILRSEWAPSLRDGMRRSGCGAADLPGDMNVECAFYGDLFRPSGSLLGPGDPWLRATDTTTFDQELLEAWWRAAAASDSHVVDPGARTLARTPGSVQAALRALSGSTFFAGLAERAMLFDLQQVRRYITEPAIRQAIQNRVAAAVGEDTRVLIGHSLGSVVAYEALCANPHWPVNALVTLGSPLGIRKLIFDRLLPKPVASKSAKLVGVWPEGVRAWTNVADSADVVALVKDLRPLFGANVVSCLVHNGAHAHAVQPYLAAAQTGAAVAAALSRAS